MDALAEHSKIINNEDYAEPALDVEIGQKVSDWLELAALGIASPPTSCPLFLSPLFSCLFVFFPQNSAVRAC